MRLLQLIKTIFVYKFVFKKIGVKSIISKPLKIDGGNNIVIGESVYVARGTWLAALPLTGAKDCLLEIGDGCNIGHYNHIYATGHIKIGKNVLTADKVYISDNLHDYQNIELPIMKQPIRQMREVSIGDGSWLGENVCVLGATIGKNCVIGANAVVTKDIPDFCVAVGAPAYIIKRYSSYTKSWRKTNRKGEFVQDGESA